MGRGHARLVDSQFLFKEIIRTYITKLDAGAEKILARDAEFYPGLVDRLHAINQTAPKDELVRKPLINSLLDYLTTTFGKPRNQWVRYCSMATEICATGAKIDVDEIETERDRIMASFQDYSGSFAALEKYFSTAWIAHPGLFYYALAVAYLHEEYAREAPKYLNTCSNFTGYLLAVCNAVENNQNAWVM